MPRLPINYAKTLIYKIVCNDLNITECYVGHTTDFVCRKKSHKERCINEKDINHNLKIYKIIRDNGGWDNYSMIEIEKYPCNDANEACAKEREWFEILNCKLNNNFPQRSKEEYYIANREEINKKKKEYYIANQDELNKRSKEYYIANIDEIKEKSSKKFVCECGKESVYSQKARHMRTKVHIDYLNTLI
jgi:ribosomal protein S8